MAEWRSPSTETATYPTLQAGRDVAEELCLVEPKKLSKTGNILGGFPPWTDPGWRPWFERVVRAHQDHPELPLCDAVLGLAHEMRESGHWLLNESKAPPLGGEDVDVLAAHLLVVHERDEGSLVRALLQVALVLMDRRPKFARSLVQRALDLS